MQRKTKKKSSTKLPQKSSGRNGTFHIEFKNDAQKLAWAAFQQHEVLFLIGPAGTGKTHLACAFALEQLLSKKKKKIVITRPIVESGESLGFLPGEFEEKVHPYMLPIYDVVDDMVGKDNAWREKVDGCLEVAPIAYMRGRAQPLTSLVLTPHGYVEMASIQVGDQVIGSNGRSVEVTGVYPQGEIDVYKVVFSDRTSTKCSGDHLWDTMTLNEKRYNKGYTTKTTLNIKNTIKTKHNQKIHRVPIISGVVCFDSQSITVDPYLLGVLLGDGHIRNSAVRLSTVDEEILEECKLRLPKGVCVGTKRSIDYSFVREDGNARNQLADQLRELGVSGCKSHNKFIPDNYKYNSEEIRLEVLKGLLDADGWICAHRSGNCRIQYCSTSKQLAQDVMFLVRSLGGHVYSRKREFDESNEHMHNGHVHPCYVVDIMIGINPFRLTRKAEKYKFNQNPVKLIADITPCGKELCQCISVNAEDGLYVTNDFIVTHNTFKNAVCIFDEAQNATLMQLKLFLSRFAEDTKVIVTGDPTQSDLGSSQVALMDVMRRLQGLDGVGLVQFKENSIVRHPLVGRILERLDD